MKNLKKIFAGLCAIALLTGTASAFDVPTQTNAALPTILTNLPQSVIGLTQSNAPAQIFQLNQGKGFGFSVEYWGTNAATTSAGTFRFAPGYKIGTTYYWATTNLAEVAVTANGTATNRNFVNFTEPTWDNFTHFKMLNITNANAATNRFFFTNAIVDPGK